MNYRIALLTTLGCVMLFSGCRNIGKLQRPATTSKYHESMLPPENETAVSSGPLTADPNLRFLAARSLEKKGQSREALRAYEKVVMDPNYGPKAFQRMGIIYQSLQETEQAEACFTKALAGSEPDADILCDVGYFYCEQNDYGKAEQLLRESLQVNPRLARAHNNLGIVLAMAGKPDAAVESFRTAGCSPNQAQANCHLALKKLAASGAQVSDRAPKLSAATQHGYPIASEVNEPVVTLGDPIAVDISDSMIETASFAAPVVER